MGTGTVENEEDTLQKRKLGKTMGNDKNVNGSVKKNSNSREVTGGRVEDLEPEFRKVEKKKKRSKEKEVDPNDVEISNLIEEVPVGDNTHAGDNNKMDRVKKNKKRKLEPEKNTECRGDDVEKKNKSSKEKDVGPNDVDFSNFIEEVPVGNKTHARDKNEMDGKEKNKKRKMEPEKNTECWGDDIELKCSKNIKKLRVNKTKDDQCHHDIVHDVKAKEHPNEYYPVNTEKKVGSMVIHENEAVSVSKTQMGPIKNESKKMKKDGKNRHKEKNGSMLVNDSEMLKDNVVSCCRSAGKEEGSDCTEVERGQQIEKKKKKKKKKKQETYKKMDKDDGGSKFLKMKSSDEVLKMGSGGATIGRDNLEGTECVREGGAESQDHVISHNKKQIVCNKNAFAVEVEKNDDQNRRKKAQSVNDVLVEETDKGDLKRKRRSKGGNRSRDSKMPVPSKKVRFSGHVEVFPITDDATDLVEEDKKGDLIQGKRFSKEEDEMIKTAVSNYIEEHGLGEDGLNKILHCRSYPELAGCWKEIAAALPRRTQQSVYYRGHILFERDEARKWTEDEYELVRRVHEKHGSKWKMMADVLGKHRFHVKDAWRRIKLTNKRSGQWTQEEYQTLFDLVNMDLRMKAFEEKKSKHGMLRDNISWGAISDRLSTRTNACCCRKWYNQLTSPMVAAGLWEDVDDYHLLITLHNLDPSCVEDVDWDNLLDHRSGDVCRKRWNQMVSHIGKHGCNSFAEQVDVLSKRYCPELLEVREAYDNKPVAN